jgi:hypothetical protein
MKSQLEVAEEGCPSTMRTKGQDNFGCLGHIKKWHDPFIIDGSISLVDIHQWQKNWNR